MIILLIFIMLISAFWSISPLKTIAKVGNFFLTGIVVYLVSKKSFIEKKWIERSILLLLGISMVVAFIGILEFIKQRSPLYHNTYACYNLYYDWYLHDGAGRIGSSIGHPVSLGAYLVLFLPLAYYKAGFIIGGRYRIVNIFSFFVGLSLLAGIILTFSRGSWIAAIIAGIFYFSRKSFKKIILVTLILFITILLFLSFSERTTVTFNERLNCQRLISDIFYSHRAASYKTTFNILKDHLFFGVGYGNFSLVHLKYLSPGASAEFPTPDNMYLCFLSEIGIIGLGVLMGLFFLFFKDLINAYRKIEDAYLKELLWALMAIFIGFFINMITVDAFFWIPIQVSFWILIGLTRAIVKEKIKS
ncbi:O-antigen ligase family protein [bacterium]|nr:O-antigen ligase family protein [bacterium]